MTIVVVEVAETSGPDWAAQLTALATLVSALILGVTAIFLRRAARAAVEQLDDARNTRHAQLIVNLSRHWNEVKRAAQLFSAYPERKLLELVLQLYGGRPTDYPVDDFITLIELPALIETIGVLEQEGGLARNLVDDLWGSTIVSAWRTWERAVITLRELTATPRTYENFERLAVRLEAYRTRRDQRAA